MLALPVVTGISGFIPSTLMMILCWLAMTSTGLLLLEVALWMEEGVHFMTMSSRLLGPLGKLVSMLIYLFICYASIVGYTAGGGLQIANFLTEYAGIPISKDMGALIFVLSFGLVIYCGTSIVGRVNAVLFIGLIVAYICLIGLGTSEIQTSLLSHNYWPTAVFGIPLLLTSFSFQTIIPSLAPYLKRHVKALRLAIVGGTTLSLLIYLIWQGLVLGIVPVHGVQGLATALEKGEPATEFLKLKVDNMWISHMAEFFAFFALVTSLLGMGLGLFDFLADSLKIKKTGWGKIALGLLIILPVIFFATQYERAFLVALDSSGCFGDAVLYGVIPVLMVWVGRYRIGYISEFSLPGGKISLTFIFVFFLFTIILGLLVYMGHIIPDYTLCKPDQFC
jgi:tyrosine-specific transport protein